MQATVRKWGNSVAVRIPVPVLEQTSLRLDQRVEVSAVDGTIVIRSARPRYTLEELVAQITPENRHEETDWGSDIGLEILPDDDVW